MLTHASLLHLIRQAIGSLQSNPKLLTFMFPCIPYPGNIGGFLFRESVTTKLYYPLVSPWLWGCFCDVGRQRSPHWEGWDPTGHVFGWLAPAGTVYRRGCISLTDHPYTQGLGSVSSCSGTDLDSVRPGRDVSVCIQGECSVPLVLHPARCGCNPSRVSTGPALCIPCGGLDPTYHAQGMVWVPHGNFSGP